MCYKSTIFLKIFYLKIEKKKSIVQLSWTIELSGKHVGIKRVLYSFLLLLTMQNHIISRYAKSQV